jgi:hypothetical protein
MLRKQAALSAAYWIIPPVLCLATYWPGLLTWFQFDDFRWLGLRQSLHEFNDLWELLFAPGAQGTTRPLSERMFFLGGSVLFGFNALPYHAIMFATMFANLGLLSQIAFRLTRSRAVGFLAALLWVVNDALQTPLSWIAAYNQILCSFFVLLAFYCFLRYVQEGQRKFLVAQWAAFLLGFGVLEINVVYPALATGFALLFSRRHLRTTLWLWIPSALFAWLHLFVIPIPAEGEYVARLDSRVFQSLWMYWSWSLGPSPLGHFGPVPQWARSIVVAVLSVFAIGFLAWRTRQGDLLPLFCLGWFFITLMPVLPLPYHRSDYYLVLPTAGLALLLALGLVQLWKRGWPARTAALIAVALYAGISVPVAHSKIAWRYGHVERIRNFVMSVVREQRQDPEKTALLAGMDNDLFRDCFYHDPFRLFGFRHVYLTPGSETALPDNQLRPVAEFVYPPGQTLRALAENKARIFKIGDDGIVQDVTSRYHDAAGPRLEPLLSRRVDVGLPFMSDQLGPTWYYIEDNFRWMPKSATVRLGGPRSPADKLILQGYAPPSHLQGDVITMTLRVNGYTLPPAPITSESPYFKIERSLPPELLGEEAVEVTVELDKTRSYPSDARELGLIFGVFEIR